MTYQEIMTILEQAAILLQCYDLKVFNQRQEVAQELISLHNTRCQEQRYYDDYIYTNTQYNVARLLPDDPVQAFIEGRQSADLYSPNDDWLSKTGYDHLVTATNGTLIDNFIYLSDIANWLDDKEEQTELLEDLADALGVELPEEEEED